VDDLGSTAEQQGPEADPGRGVLLTELKEELQRLLPLLPVEKEKVIRLYYFEGLGRREIAEKLGIPEGTVDSRKHEGLKKLRQLLETESGDSEKP
jgi:RNA polymerase sigma factor (sigma-70 family)